MRPRIHGKLRQTVLAVVTFIFLTTAPSPSLRAHSSLPTHVVAVGGDRAVIWNDQTATFDVHSLCDGSFLHELDLGTATPNQVLFDESRLEFFGTGSGNGERSYVWQWQVSQSRPTVTPVVSAGRLWSVHQHGGKRYVVYTAAGGSQVKLGELDRSLNVIEIMDLPDLVPEPEGCIVSGPAAPGEGARYLDRLQRPPCAGVQRNGRPMRHTRLASGHNGTWRRPALRTRMQHVFCNEER